MAREKTMKHKKYKNERKRKKIIKHLREILRPSNNNLHTKKGPSSKQTNARAWAKHKSTSTQPNKYALHSILYDKHSDSWNGQNEQENHGSKWNVKEENEKEEEQ